jgi:hypothetical protein
MGSAREPGAVSSSHMIRKLLGAGEHHDLNDPGHTDKAMLTSFMRKLNADSGWLPAAKHLLQRGCRPERRVYPFPGKYITASAGL